MEPKFKVGDNVHDKKYGFGVVRKVDPCNADAQPLNLGFCGRGFESHPWHKGKS